VLPAVHAIKVVVNPFIRPCSWGSDSSSSGEDERRRRRRKVVTCAVTSALPEANASLDAPMRGVLACALSGREGAYMYVGGLKGHKDEDAVLCVNCDTSCPVLSPGPRGGPACVTEF
jgi:hypothetical protein